MALYLDVVENFLVTPRTGVGVAFNKGILIDINMENSKNNTYIFSNCKVYNFSFLLKNVKN